MIKDMDMDYETYREVVALAIDKNHPKYEEVAKIGYETGTMDMLKVKEWAESLLDTAKLKAYVDKPSNASKAEDWVTSEYCVDLITPWVEDARQTIFNSRTAPFKSTEQGFNWVEEQEELREKERELELEKVEWQRLEDTYFKKYPNWKDYPFIACDHEEYPRSELKESVLGVLYPKAHEIADAIGFDFVSVVYFILTNNKPTLPRYKLHTSQEVHKLPSGADFVNRFVTVIVRSELSFGELRSLYRDIRQELRIKRTKALQHKHLELYRLVQQLGGPPKKGERGAVRFWEGVREKWKEKYSREDRFNSWRAVKQAYYRTHKKFVERYFLPSQQ